MYIYLKDLEATTLEISNHNTNLRISFAYKSDVIEIIDDFGSKTCEGRFYFQPHHILSPSHSRCTPFVRAQCASKQLNNDANDDSQQRAKGAGEKGERGETSGER